MTNKIEVNFRLNGKIKHISASPDTKVSELIEKLKQGPNKEQVTIELFYGGRFLNPDFTLKNIKYDTKFPIDVFTSSDEYKKWYDELSQSCLSTSYLNVKDIIDRSASQESIDDDLAHTCFVNKLKKGIPRNVCDELKAQAEKNNVDESVMYLLYKQLGGDKEKALSFFNDDKKAKNPKRTRK